MLDFLACDIKITVQSFWRENIRVLRYVREVVKSVIL